MIEFVLNTEAVNFTLNVELEQEIPITPDEGIFDETFDETFE